MRLESKTKNYQGRDYIVVRPFGELDMANAEEFKQQIIQALQKSNTRNLMFDFSAVDFIDSSGLGVIMGRYRALAPLGGEMIIRHANPQVYKLLLASGMQRIIEVERPLDIFGEQGDEKEVRG